MKDSIQNEKVKSEEDRIDDMWEIIFSNVKLYIESQLHRFDSFFQEVSDIKLNLITLSSILNSKNIFGEKEYRECFSQIKHSFGEVKEDETMDGSVEITCYNF